MTNREPLREKLYYTFIPLHKKFFSVQIDKNSEIINIKIFFLLVLKEKKFTLGVVEIPKFFYI
jgi:hypothetical protein